MSTPADPPADRPFEVGIYSFVERTADPTGQVVSPAQRLADLLEEIELADQVGLDVFALGEHHREEFVSSAPAVILAAARTETIRLSSAVTVLSSDDPVRVFQHFATLDLISEGRAEIMAGRGSFIESFPLFGYDLNDYHELFSEKLELLLTLLESERVTWSGKQRPLLAGPGRLPAPPPGPAAGVDRGGRHPRICGSRWHPGPADGPGDYRWRPRALRAARRGLPRGRRPRRPQPRHAPAQHQLPRLHCRRLKACRRRIVPRRRGGHEQDRPRARLAPP